MRTPLAPLASANTVSLVEHSPSTVMALKVVSQASIRARCSSAGGTAASGGDEAEHRGQHGLDHPRALAGAADVVDAGGGLDADRVLLRERIGRHDGARRVGVRVELSAS